MRGDPANYRGSGDTARPRQAGPRSGRRRQVMVDDLTDVLNAYSAKGTSIRPCALLPRVVRWC